MEIVGISQACEGGADAAKPLRLHVQRTLLFRGFLELTSVSLGPAPRGPPEKEWRLSRRRSVGGLAMATISFLRLAGILFASLFVLIGISLQLISVRSPPSQATTGPKSRFSRDIDLHCSESDDSSLWSCHVTLTAFCCTAKHIKEPKQALWSLWVECVGRQLKTLY